MRKKIVKTDINHAKNYFVILISGPDVIAGSTVGMGTTSAWVVHHIWGSVDVNAAL